MKLLVLGASGGCGRWVVRLAAERGHTVTAVVRSQTAYEAPEGVEVVRGEVVEKDFLAPFLADHEVIISCLGQRRANPAPWSKLLSPPDLVQTVAKNLAGVIPGTPVRRLVWISAGGVGDSHAMATPTIQRMIRMGKVGIAYRDLNRAEEVLNAEGIANLSVRPVTLLPGMPKGNAVPAEKYGLFSTIRRSDVAKWMVDVADGTVDCPASTVLLGTR
ncbi:MAG: NAD(P)H-binding protein [Sumerlaeia bacterium]